MEKKTVTTTLDSLIHIQHSVISNLEPLPLDVPFSHFTIGYFKLSLFRIYFSISLRKVAKTPNKTNPSHAKWREYLDTKFSNSEKSLEFRRFID